ncbi:hypothetical protein [Streptomyces monomycini]|uniref:hypothetical protein n=1 Tax=Streptomyces monomycini TaxID=371720 RepID=UPI00051898DE|nr:hypothetical protein [Streptomyces monomycini]
MPPSATSAADALPPYDPLPQRQLPGQPLPRQHPPRQRPAESTPRPDAADPSATAFDPRALTDFQLDELVHRIIGRVTRLIRTELRMDRERIGRLRDPRQ